jgi:hypothetical protein
MLAMWKNISKIIFLYISVGLTVPIIFLVNAFVMPEPYSHPLINVATAPTKLMPFLENRKLLGELTQWVFGRQTPNYAPIITVILIVFWFVVSMMAFYLMRLLLPKKKNT